VNGIEVESAPHPLATGAFQYDAAPRVWEGCVNESPPTGLPYNSRNAPLRMLTKSSCLGKRVGSKPKLLTS
jgi:hypothetical protein